MKILVEINFPENVENPHIEFSEGSIAAKLIDVAEMVRDHGAMEGTFRSGPSWDSKTFNWKVGVE